MVAAGRTKRYRKGDASGNVGDSTERLVKSNSHIYFAIFPKSSPNAIYYIYPLPHPLHLRMGKRNQLYWGFCCGESISSGWTNLHNSSGICTVGWSLVVWYIALGWFKVWEILTCCVRIRQGVVGNTDMGVIDLHVKDVLPAQSLLSLRTS